jgi:Staphylococcal nuclease homologue
MKSPTRQTVRFGLGLLLVFVGLAVAQQFARVKRAIDGDTIMLESGERVRLIGVDTPESVDPRRPVERFGKEASSLHALHVRRQTSAAGVRSGQMLTVTTRTIPSSDEPWITCTWRMARC